MAETKTKIQTEKKATRSTDLVVAKVVRTILAGSRHATAKTKKRGEVSGGGKKPWKQKGTGRARAGSTRSPLWRSGGVVFGPTGVQNFKLKASKKEKAIALSAAFEEKKAQTKNIATPAPKKTKEAAEWLKKNELTGKVLVLLDVKLEAGKKQDEKMVALKRAFKNIPNVVVMFKSEANAYDVLTANNIAICKVAIAKETK